MILFKYCGTSHIVENLSNNQIHLSPLAELNDPYEGFHRHEVSEKITEEYYKYFDFKKINTDKSGDDDKKELEYRIVSKAKDAVDDLFYITSFSEVSDSLTMWGHYAEKQKGVCLAFDSTMSIFRNASPIKYCKDIQPIVFSSEKQFTDSHLVKGLKKICFVKHDSWSYEREWRILCLDKPILHYNHNSLKAIYFGYKTPTSIRRDIYRTTKHIWGLLYYEQVLFLNEYKNDFLEVDRNYLESL